MKATAPTDTKELHDLALGDLLSQIARILDLPFSANQLASVIQASTSASTWMDATIAGIDMLGAHARHHEGSAQQALLLVRETGGLILTLVPETETWLLITSATRKRAECLRINIPNSARITSKIDAAELTSMIECECADWVLIEPRLTMQAISPMRVSSSPERNAINRIKGLIHLEREGIIAILVYSLLLGVLSLLTPIAVQALVNTIAFGVMLQPILILAIMVFTGLVFVGTLRVLQHVVVEYIQRRIFVRLVTDLSYRLPRVAIQAHEKKHVPELVNRFFDVVTVQKAAATLLMDSLGLVLQMVLGLLVLAFYHPYLLVFDIVLGFALFFVVVILGRGAIHSSIHESHAKYSAAAWLEEIARHPLGFKSKRSGGVASWRAEELSMEWLHARKDHFGVILRQIIGASVVQAIASAGLLGLGGWLVMTGQLTLGQLVAAELIVTSVAAGVAKFGKDLETYYDLVAGLDKIGKLVDLPMETDHGQLPVMTDEPMRVEVSGASMKLGSGSFCNVDFVIDAGEIVGMIGEDGAALSGFLDVLYGLRNPGHGLIKIQGVSLHELSIAALRDQIALVRERDLFEGSIDDNLRLANRYVEPDKVRDLLAQLKLGDELRRLPEGLHTKLGPNGSPLALDQQHRITLARVLLGEPELILVDRALDTLHPNHIKRVFETIRDRNISALVVSNRPDVLAKCTRVFELEGAGVKLLKQPVGSEPDGEV